MRKNIVFFKDYLNSDWTVPSKGKRRMLAANGGELRESQTSQYAQMVVEVNNFMISVLQTKIPPITPAPDHLSEYSSELALARASALKWNSEINGDLLALPSTTVSGLQKVSTWCERAIKRAEALQKDLSEEEKETKKEELEEEIGDAKNKVEEIIEDLESLVGKLKSFKTELPEQAAELLKISNLMEQDSSADAEKVEKLKKDIDALNDKIDELTAAIIGLGIADGTALILSGVALLAGPVGAVTWLFTGAAIAVATTYIVLDTMEINTCKDVIEADEKEIGALNTAIATLQTQAETFNKLAAEADALQENVESMIESWATIQNGLAEIETELANAGDDYTKEDWASVESDLQNAKTKTDDIIEPIKSLDISDMQGCDAKVEPGMSQEEIEKAVNSAEKMSIVEYIKKIG